MELGEQKNGNHNSGGQNSAGSSQKQQSHDEVGEKHSYTQQSYPLWPTHGKLQEGLSFIFPWGFRIYCPNTSGFYCFVAPINLNLILNTLFLGDPSLILTHWEKNIANNSHKPIDTINVELSNVSPQMALCLIYEKGIWKLLWIWAAKMFQWPRGLVVCVLRLSVIGQWGMIATIATQLRASQMLK